MAHETLICAEGVAPERLSALRDDALPASEAQLLREHIAGCAACRARLKNYGAMTLALRQQRELEPGERIVSGVNARLARGVRPGGRRTRRLSAGLAALAPVAAIILLFVYLFSGLAGRERPATTKTPTAAIATATPRATATAGVDGLPPMTPSVSGDTAWGALNPSTAFITTISPQTFVPQAMAPDGRTLVGVQEPASTATAGTTPVFALGTYDPQTHQFTAVGPTWKGYASAGGAIGIDDHYIVYSVNDAPGATCGECNQTLSAIDRQTGATWTFDPAPAQGSGAQYMGVQQAYFSNDHVAFVSILGQVWVADLATHRVTLTLPVGAKPATASSQPGPDIRVLSFAWPYLIYTISTSAEPQPALDILNLQTGVNTTTAIKTSALLSPQNSNSVSVSFVAAYLSGGALYIVTATTLTTQNATGASVQFFYGTLYSVGNVLAGNGKPTLLARWRLYGNGADGATDSNARLITLGGGYVWDLVEGRLVKVEPTSVPGPVTFSLAGNYLLTLGPMPANYPQPYGPAQQGVIYDTSQFGTR